MIDSTNVVPVPVELGGAEPMRPRQLSRWCLVNAGGDELLALQYLARF